MSQPTSLRNYAFLLLALVLLFVVATPVARHLNSVPAPSIIPNPIPRPTPPPAFTREYTAALDVARVFGRSPGCTDASPELITAVAAAAVKVKLDARIFAATVAFESGCNQYAVSNRGAIGFTQVVPRIWKDKYDFTKEFNLFNRDQNLAVGATIEADMIKQYGLVNGLRHYNGMDITSVAYDGSYASKIPALAGVK